MDKVNCQLSTNNCQPNKTLLVILGPTGVGKTNISLRLAEHFGCPIVSSDSRQFYRELKIGTAAPTEEQLKRVKHYFIGSHSIFDEYNAGQYEQDAIQLLDELFQKQDVVMLVGGSMMYIDAVCNGMDDIPTVDADIRAFWQTQYADFGLEYIQNELQWLDPVHYHQVDIQNPKRELYIQMTAQVYIILSQAKDVLLIPTSAVGNASEGSEIKVNVLKEDNSVEIRAIKIGIKGEISTEVKEGLSENELVVIGGIKEKPAAKTQSALSGRRGGR